MKYLFLMFFKYYRGSKGTKYKAYFSSLLAVCLYSYIVILGIISLLGVNLTIKGMGTSRIQDYFIIGCIMFVMTIFLYYLYPPKKIKILYKSFRNNKIYNVIIIILLVSFFCIIMSKNMG